MGGSTSALAKMELVAVPITIATKEIAQNLGAPLVGSGSELLGGLSVVRWWFGG